MNSELYSHNNSEYNYSVKSDNISNFNLNISLRYKLIYIVSNILLIITYIIAFVFLILFKERISILSFNDFFFMQTHLTSFIICITIHIFILLYTLLNAWKQKDFDFKKQFYSDAYYFSPLQNFLFIVSYVLGIICNMFDYYDNESENSILKKNENNEKNLFFVKNIFSFFFIFVFLALMIISLLNLRKNQRVVNLSYNSMICFLVQSAVSFSIATYLFLFSNLFILQINKIFENEILEIFTIAFYIVYTIIAITLMSKKEISYAVILVIIFIGCACNSYETELSEFKDKELITIFACMGITLFCILYMSVRYRKEIFAFKNDESIENFINNRLISDRIDPTI